MKKISILAVMLISTKAFSQSYQHDTGDSIEVCYDSAKHKWSALSQYVLLSRDTSGKERVQVQAMIVSEGNKFVYKGFLIANDEENNPCIDSAKIKIVFTDGTIYEDSSWDGRSCESMCLFDYYGDTFYFLDKKIYSITFTNGETKKSFHHIISQEKNANYFTRIGNALRNKQYIITSCD